MTDQKIEKIGGVTLDYTQYPGQDFYCDGEVEKELLSLVREQDPDRYDEIIRKRADWPTLYHLSSIRGNIVSWIPFKGTEKVLEIGAGPGAITSAIAGMVGSVTCVELSRTRSLINAWRNKEHHNITIRVGNFEDIEPLLEEDYDYVLLIGVLEYAASYIHGEEDPYLAELTKIRRHLKPEGRLVIAIENRLGMKYFAGCREDHTARYFDGIENYPVNDRIAHTFSRPVLEKLLRKSGIDKYQFFYPYPDYKFMSAVYSEERLPRTGELGENIRNFDRDRMLLFDEKKALGAVREDGLFGLFSNSFVIVTGEKLPVQYARYSNDRAPRYRICTRQIVENGRKLMEKYPAGAEAVPHIRKLQDACDRLKARFAGGRLQVIDCMLEGDRAFFPFLEGETLEDRLDRCLERKDFGTFWKLIEEYREAVSYRDELPAADEDMIFANILVQGDTWTAIDYEWFTEHPVAGKDLLLRAMNCYFLGDPGRKQRLLQHFSEEEIREKTGSTADRDLQETAGEKEFQNRITEGNTALGDLRAQLGKKVIIPLEIAQEEIPAEEKAVRAENLAAVQVYTDTGKGFSEEESYFVEQPYQGEGMITFRVHVPETVRKLRIDPALCPCVVLLHQAGTEKGQTDTFRKFLQCNGTRIGEETMVFSTADPWMVWDMGKIRKKAGLGTGGLELLFTLQMTGIPGTMAACMKGTVPRRLF